VFSRLICTQFQDRALAIGLHLDNAAKDDLRQAEINHMVALVPNPALKILADPRVNLIDANFDKNQVEIGGSTIGAWMLYIDGKSSVAGFQSVYRDENGQLDGDVNATGGFVGDGFAAFGWWYLFIFGGAAFSLFLFSDSLYGFISDGTSQNPGWRSAFAMVGLINGYILATVFNVESIAELVRFVIRKPLQWLVVYGVVFWIIRFATRTLFGGKTKARRLPKMAIVGAK
jgi:hypothetical protein